jgi:transcriptional regulator with GAF, ATPase, and Fis domain
MQRRVDKRVARYKVARFMIPGVPPDPPGTTQWLTRDAAPLRLQSHKIRVEVLGGPDAGRQVELPGPEVRVGSAPDCDLQLRDPTVSRHHLTVRLEDDRIRIMDAGSRNGTFLDGLCVRDAYARPDSHIALGQSSLRLAMLPEVVEIPLSPRERFGGLIGRSVAMRRVFAVLERVAPTDATVLVEGETGTGKELVAEAIHDESPRAGGPLVVFDCSAVSPTLIESELFGHVRGAFTGAVADRQGAFEAADGGTLFLDEIGELPLELQPKLLRVLERREVRRLGSNQARRLDVRIVAATNRSLAREIERGRFREDLYYRLAVVDVALPPLRERPEDIPVLIEHLVRQVGGPQARLPERVSEALRAQSYSGNVRELRNAVARALSLAGPGAAPLATAAPESFAMAIDLSAPLREGRDRVLDAYERAYLQAALERTGGNVTRAAELAGVNRKFIQRAMKRLGLREG